MSIIDYKSALIRSILAIAVGVLFCLFPTEMARWSVIVIGGIMVFGAVVSFAVKGFAKQRPLTPGDFLQLIFLAAFGIFVIWEHEFFARFIMLCLGLLLVLGGGSQLSVVIGSRRILNVPLPFMKRWQHNRQRNKNLKNRRTICLRKSVCAGSSGRWARSSVTGMLRISRTKK